MGSRTAGLRRKVAFGQYELTAHAVDEVDRDGLTIEDLKSAICSGTIAAVQRRGRGRRKFVVSGRCECGRPKVAVCRLTPSRRMRVITVYAR